MKTLIIVALALMVLSVFSCEGINPSDYTDLLDGTDEPNDVDGDDGTDGATGPAGEDKERLTLTEQVAVMVMTEVMEYLASLVDLDVDFGSSLGTE